ncbi:MAG TPA: histidinol-phosphatase [Chitinispirillaceae bacterium]|nr:histidinol-phosphatase [Chitinispirillaceae bacterium]
MTSDFHIHTTYCGHATGSTLQYIENAIAKGLKEIGFADHLGRYYLTSTQKRRYWDWGMNDHHIGRYFDEISALSSTFDDAITIKVGLEVDFIEGAEDLFKPLVNGYEFDFFLGSIHCLPRFGWKHLSEYRSSDAKKVYDEYFRLLRLAITSHLFHSIAHPDFIFRYIPVPKELNEYVINELKLTVQTARDHRIPLEINANSFLWSAMNQPGFDPFLIMLDLIAESAPLITIGSDAHEPRNVGKAFPELKELLISRNLRQYVIFSGKKQTVRTF